MLIEGELYARQPGGARWLRRFGVGSATDSAVGLPHGESSHSGGRGVPLTPGGQQQLVSCLRAMGAAHEIRRIIALPLNGDLSLLLPAAIANAPVSPASTIYWRNNIEPLSR